MGTLIIYPQSHGVMAPLRDSTQATRLARFSSGGWGSIRFLIPQPHSEVSASTVRSHGASTRFYTSYPPFTFFVRRKRGDHVTQPHNRLPASRLRSAVEAWWAHNLMGITIQSTRGKRCRDRVRARDLTVTSRALYPLSYIGLLMTMRDGGGVVWCERRICDPQTVTRGQ